MPIIKGVCNRCHNKEVCTRPCWFLEMLLADVTDGNLERLDGDDRIIYFGENYWETRFSEIDPRKLKKVVFDLVKDQDEDEEDPDARFDDLEFTPEQKTADIFYMRFFKGYSYEAIGAKYGIGRREAATYYGHGKARVLEIMEILDGRDRAMKWYHDKARNNFTKHQQAFILSKIFGFSFKEIAEMLGYRGPDAIQHKVNGMANEIRKEIPAG